MRAYTAADGDLHRAKSEGAIDTDALRGDFDLVVVVVGVVVVGSCVGSGGVLGVGAAGFGAIVSVSGGEGGGGGVMVVGAGRVGAGKPGGWVRDRWGVVLWVAGVVDDFFEADVVVVGGVSVRLDRFSWIEINRWGLKGLPTDVA